MGLPERTRFQILSPVVRSKKGHAPEGLLRTPARAGGARPRGRKHLRFDRGNRPRQEQKAQHRSRDRPARDEAGSGPAADRLGGDGGEPLRRAYHLKRSRGRPRHDVSQNYACEDCGISLPELSPRMFSFNNPYGACPVCTGLGTQLVADPDLIIPDWDKSILDGAIQSSGWNNLRMIPSRGCISRRWRRSTTFR